MVPMPTRPNRPGIGHLVAGLLALIGPWLALPASAFTVFACEPEWAALTRVLLPTAKLHVATHPGQDPHHIEARSALIAQLRSADLAVCTGASLEAGWLPTLQERAGNARVRDVFFAADFVKLIDPQPGAIGTPWAGDVHAEGNPHLHMDPRNLLEVAFRLNERLGQEIPAERAAIAQRHAAFEARWRQQIAGWEKLAAPLRGQTVAGQHTSFGYLWHWLGIKQLADLEPRPGMSPTPGHLQRLLEGLRARPPLLVAIAGFHDPRPGRWLTAQLASQGIPTPLLVLPTTVSEDGAEKELVQWMDGLLRELLQTPRR